MAIILLLAIVILSVITHRWTIELPIDLIANLALPQWLGGAIAVLLFSWLLDDEAAS